MHSFAVLEECGRAVPVYNDKHLAYRPEDADWVVETAEALGIPLWAGLATADDCQLPLQTVCLRGRVECLSLLWAGSATADDCQLTPLQTLGTHCLTRHSGLTGFLAALTLPGKQPVYEGG